MRVYLSSPYFRRRELLRYARALSQRGHVVTSTWLTCHTEQVTDDGTTLTGDPGALAMLAVMDYRDIEECDLLIAFGEPATVHVRGGYLQEIGFAQGKGKRVVVVGARRTLACHHPGVRHCESWEDCLKWLEEEAWSKELRSTPTPRGTSRGD